MTGAAIDQHSAARAADADAGDGADAVAVAVLRVWALGY